MRIRLSLLTISAQPSLTSDHYLPLAYQDFFSLLLPPLVFALWSDTTQTYKRNGDRMDEKEINIEIGSIRQK